jgi:hypothetical protein
MNNKKSTGYIITAIIGCILAALGVGLAILYTEPEGIMRGLPFALIGVGLGAFGGGLGGALSNRILRKNPSLAKQKEIEVNDERNITIANRAKAKVFDFTSLLFAALLIFLAVMQVQSIIVIIFAVLYVLRFILFIYLLNKYHKEM